MLRARALHHGLWILLNLVDRFATELGHRHFLLPRCHARLRCRRVHAILADATAFHAKRVLLDGHGRGGNQAGLLVWSEFSRSLVHTITVCASLLERNAAPLLLLRLLLRLVDDIIPSAGVLIS